MKTLLIDDERLARKEFTKLLSDYPEIEIIEECSNGIEAVEKIDSLKPELIFLDIQMPGMTGFEVLEKIKHIPRVVFVTAYDEYAIKAFEVSAMDYLLKPVDPSRLKNTISKLKEEEIEDNISEENENEEKLAYSGKIFIKDGDKCWFVSLSDIRYFEADGNYVKVFFQNFKPMILKSLSNLEERLDEKHFFRISRKHIVNINRIKNIETWFNGGLRLTLDSDEELEVSRRQAVKFKDQMGI